ncbi:unnamed protein product [Rotaria sordida]|uniref:VCBS repeat-containing protein n=1 Tax=Rotaria sordida TaxID=392033 RepID=A0A814KBC3_9BILA|nr:unnamed protein product [Rotaria sordida]CAF1048744.1 unnamed protein product [Rotaria sordida]
MKINPVNIETIRNNHHRISSTSFVDRPNISLPVRPSVVTVSTIPRQVRNSSLKTQHDHSLTKDNRSRNVIDRVIRSPTKLIAVVPLALITISKTTIITSTITPRTTTITTATTTTSTSATTTPWNKFPAQMTYSTGLSSGPYSVATGDVNGDNKTDIIVANYGTDNVGVLINTGNGTFVTQVTYSTGFSFHPFSVTTADVNGDSKIDIIAANNGADNVGVLLNTGTGTFSGQVTYATGSSSYPCSVAAADVNGDTHLDIIVLNYFSHNVGVFFNTGTGTFGAQMTYSTGSNSYPYSVAVVDVNGDSKIDIIVANSNAANIGVLLNTGIGTFVAQVSYTTGTSSYPYSVAVADVNGDSKVDIIVANANADNVGVLLNTGTGTFAAQMSYTTGASSSPYYVVTTDVNGDTYLDIIVANKDSDKFGVFLNTGNGTFIGQVTYSTGSASQAYFVAAADLNGDTRVDIIVANRNANNVGVFLAACN